MGGDTCCFLWLECLSPLLCLAKSYLTFKFQLMSLTLGSISLLPDWVMALEVPTALCAVIVSPSICFTEF